MKNKNFGKVSDTAYLTACLKAQAHADANSVFVDEYVQRFAKLCPNGVKNIMKGTLGADVVMERSLLFDQIIANIFEQNHIDVCVFLGAGFDTRVFRLPCLQECVVVEVDVAEIFLVKNVLLPVSGLRVERLVCDISDLDVFFALLYPKTWGRKVLFVAEGFLTYFSLSLQKRLLQRLGLLSVERLLLCDVLSEASAKFLSKSAKSSGLQMFGLQTLDIFTETAWVCSEMHLLPCAQLPHSDGVGGFSVKVPDSVAVFRGD